MSKEKMSVYVGTYAKYNDGDLHGKWMNLNDYSSYEEFMEACHKLHEDESDPELMFQDWEHMPEPLIGESWLSEKTWDLMNEVDDDEWEPFSLWVDDIGVSIEDSTYDGFRDVYEGEWDSELDYATYLFDEVYADSIPEFARSYIDYNSFAKDLFLDYTFIDGYVFRDR